MSVPAHLLFLDFDGVLHPHDAHFAVADVKVPIADLLAAGLFVHRQLLDDLLRPHPSLGLVVHSTWRKTHDLRELRTLLGPLGSRLVGSTAAAMEREASILDFMRRRGVRAEQVLVLDDAPSEFSALRSRVVACSPARGLSEAGVQSLLQSALGALCRQG
ncbi:HAD domain-containing protein [Pelomonas sp. SE-A7]|uniref:HAD domain-containing protein n=1 Tax=Pelomonas sp. SE-A7 TaxID=3054953 RepID=UPI00259C6E20|nr:HAD domain-containing protein [Pelomonas sp. SE-A7]MDM4768313.1 HAD domain-containing protein [Pelomonas sp. SE-A7]